MSGRRSASTVKLSPWTTPIVLTCMKTVSIERYPCSFRISRRRAYPIRRPPCEMENQSSRSEALATPSILPSGLPGDHPATRSRRIASSTRKTRAKAPPANSGHPDFQRRFTDFSRENFRR